MNFFSFHIGDYAAHTKHLTLIEDIAYRRMLDLYYMSEKPLPLDPGQLARLIGMREHLSEVASVSAEFFTKAEDGYRSKRCDEEIAIYHSKVEQASRAGKASAQRRINTLSTPVQRSFNAGSTDVQPTNNQEPITNNHSKELTVAEAPALPVAHENDFLLARFIYQRVLAVQPKAKEPKFDKWANTIRLMREQDKRTHKQIQDVFLWANRDPFWKANVMSPDSLRKQLDKLEVQMQNKGQSGTAGKSMADRMAHETYKHLIEEEGGNGQQLLT